MNRDDGSTGCDCDALKARIAQLEAQVAVQAQQLQSQVEIQVEARTRDLQAVNQLLKRQSKTMTQHFAVSRWLRLPFVLCIIPYLVLETWHVLRRDGFVQSMGRRCSVILHEVVSVRKFLPLRLNNTHTLYLPCFYPWAQCMSHEIRYVPVP